MECFQYHIDIDPCVFSESSFKDLDSFFSILRIAFSMVAELKTAHEYHRLELALMQDLIRSFSFSNESTVSCIIRKSAPRFAMSHRIPDVILLPRDRIGNSCRLQSSVSANLSPPEFHIFGFCNGDNWTQVVAYSPLKISH